MSFFIAEISSNHGRDLKRCYEFIDKAAEIGCDCAKFQLFRIDELFTQDVLRRRPEINARKEWELPVEFLPLLAQRCQQKNIQFSCTPFYLEAIDQLAPFVSFYKIASYTLLWDALLAACAKKGKPVTLSTGMATLAEVEHAVHVLKTNGCVDITLLHCVSAYPTPVEECNLSAIKTLRDHFHCKVGWSDHTVQAGVIHRAIQRWGAEVIEFHFDLEGAGAEFGGGHCWLPHAVQSFIKETRVALLTDGTSIKAPVAAETVERLWRTDPSDGLRPLKEIREDTFV
jgi:sialic acid synthase SpsE